MIDLSDVAARLISRFGSPSYVVAIDPVGGTFDPATSEVTGESEQTTKITAVVLEINDELRDGTRIRRSEENSKRLIFDKSYSPTMKTSFEFGGERYKTIEIGGFNHAGTQQYWEVICQK